MPRRRCRRGDLACAMVIAVATAIAAAGAAAAAGDNDAGFDYRKLSGIIIPGFASTQLRAWSVLDCPYSPFDFNPLDSVWLDTAKLFSALNCWLKCMLLDPYNQTDHPECKSRPDSGLSAITELDPGYITGPLSSVWKEWVKWCVEFGIEANAIIAVPYDWRLPSSMLEERDLYFHKLKLTFEIALKLRGGPSLVFPHSMGNNVFRYFLEWLKLEIAPKHYIQWLDEHIHAYFIVGAPLLGSTEAVRGALSGTTFGLPVSESIPRAQEGEYDLTRYPLRSNPDSRLQLHPPLSIHRKRPKKISPYHYCQGRSGNSVSGKHNNSSGDGVVSYNSLSWCKNWLGPKVNITRAPQAEHDGSELQTSMNVEHYHGQDLFPNMTRAPHVKYITYYEDAESIPRWRTAVWELDKANPGILLGCQY